jgi:DNA-binding IscR family transcriptional regulator
VLIGAKLSFVIQNFAAYEFQEEGYEISNSYRQLMSLYIAHFCVGEFVLGNTPKTMTQMSNALKIPLYLLRRLISELIHAGILVEVKIDNSQDCGYQPAKDCDSLTVKAVLDALNNAGDETIPLAHTKSLGKLKECLATFHEMLQHSKANVSLKDI